MPRKTHPQKTHFSKSHDLTRKGKVVTWPDGRVNECHSISTARRFMRTGKEAR